MSGDGAAEGTVVTLMVARARAGPPQATQGQKGRDHRLLHALCDLSAVAGASCVA